MGRKDTEGRSDVEKFRKNIGKQEFKGRSKKKTLSIRDKAQSKKSSGTIQIVLLYLFVILAVLVSLYFVFYTVYASNKAESHSS
ncbi:hypothetical protein ACROYT_G013595 [Oculina patagonica]